MTEVCNKLKLPTTITATYKIITPMFIGDAEQQATTISPQSFKGALRFWWRALAWGRIREASSSDEEALKELHHQEAVLFGSSANNPKDEKNNTYGKGQFAIKIEQPEKLKVKSAGSVHPELKKYSASRYLGYGVIEAFASRNKGIEAGQLVRDCIDENQYFSVSLIVEGNDRIDEMSNILKLIGLLGGLGSKARKGFGSINLTKLTVSGVTETQWEPPQSFEEYQTIVQQLLKRVVGCEMPPFSALSSKAFIEKTVNRQAAYEVLENYGKAMMLYRSWGKNGKVLDDDAERNFKDDHDWSKSPNNFKPNFHPDRVIFGLPHNYGKIQVGRDLKKQYGRRASPLFFHVQQIGNEFIGVAYILRSQFLPANEGIKADKNTVPQNINWDILQKNFLQDKQRFPDAVVIYGGEQQ